MVFCSVSAVDLYGQDCTFDVVRESVCGTFSVGTGVTVGFGAGIAICVL